MGACSIEGCDRPAKARGWCDKHYHQWWRKAHPEKVREYARKWREANREQERARSRTYWEEHLEQVQEDQRKYREANREMLRDKSNEHQKAHPEQARARVARRRARKAQTVCDLSLEDQRDILIWGCFFAHLGDCEGPLCNAHDVALSKGGNTTRANVLCLCRRHNLQMRTQGLADILKQLEMFREE